MWSQYNTRIKFSAYNSSDEGGSYQDSIVLPVDTLEVRGEPYVPEGGTVLELYDDRRTYRDPTYGYMITLNYDFERTEYRSSSFGYLHEIPGLLVTYDFIDVFVNYDGSSFKNNGTSPSVTADYKCVKMIPDVTEDMAPSVFNKQKAEKPRELELLSNSRSYIKTTVEWIFE